MKIPRRNRRITRDELLFLIGLLGLTVAFGSQFLPAATPANGWALGRALLLYLLIGSVGSLAFFLLLFLLISVGLVSISKFPKKRP